MLGGKRFRFFGFNSYTLMVDSASASTINQLLGAESDRGARVLRTWCFDRGKPPTNSSGNLRYLSGSSLVSREATFVQLDTILDYARIHGIKLVLCLADNTTNYDTKNTYVDWANSINSAGLTDAYPYVDFFNSIHCRNLLESNFSILANRRNTINGRIYKEDDTIGWWELGNEMRYDVFDAEGGTQNTSSSTNIVKVMNWADDMAGRIKAIDPNHLVAFSSVTHTWQWVEGDTVSNGSGYGADYNLFCTLANVDILDFHLYPTQGGGETQILKYGQRLGYANAVNGPGLDAQIANIVTSVKAGGKVCVCGETGFIREAVGLTNHWPLYPRHSAFKRIFDIIMDNDGDGMLIWSATYSGGGSYSVSVGPWTGSTTNANYDDRELMSTLVRKLHSGSRIPASADV